MTQSTKDLFRSDDNDDFFFIGFVFHGETEAVWFEEK